MNLSFFHRNEGTLEASEKARLVHSAWLTRALRSGRSWPTIPLRRASEGGFAPVMRTPEGRAWVESWWTNIMAELGRY